MTLQELLKRPTGQRISVDTETTGLFPDDPCLCGCGRRVHITMVGIAGDGFSVSLPFAAQQAENLPRTAWNDLIDWLLANLLEWANGKFDQHQFDRGTPNGWMGTDLSSAFDWDTMLASWVLWPTEDVSLKATARRVFGKDAAPEDTLMKGHLMSLPRGQQKDFWRVPFGIQGPYNEADARLTHRLAAFQREEVKKLDFAGDDLAPIVQREFEVMQSLFHMEQRGIGFNVTLAQERGTKYATRQAIIEGVLPFKATRGEALKYWEKQGTDLSTLGLETTATGRWSLNGNGLKKVVRLGLPGAQLLEEYLALDRALGTWYGPEGWASHVGPDGRARTDYKQHGTVTMRFSSRHMNFQAIPQAQTIDAYVENVRDLFVPKPGHVLVELDLSNAELRIATSYARCERMYQEFLKDKPDIHSDTARSAFNIGPEHARWDDYRRTAKVLTFAMLYGAGVDGLDAAMRAEGKDWSTEQSVSFLNTFHGMYPEFLAITREAARKAKDRQFVRLISGRKRVFNLKSTWNDDWKRWMPQDNTWSAFNTVVQGGVAEFMKTTMLHIDQKYPGILLLQVHDSVVLEVPEPQYEATTLDIIAWVEEQASAAFRIRMKMERKKWKTHALVAQ